MLTLLVLLAAATVSLKRSICAWRSLTLIPTLPFVLFSNVVLAQGIPDLSKFDPQTRQLIESACTYSKHMEGPAGYAACLNKHSASATVLERPSDRSQATTPRPSPKTVPNAQPAPPTQPQQPKAASVSQPEAARSFVQSVPMQKQNGIFVVPVLINDSITLKFVVDSGASDVSIPADVVMTLMRTGTLTENDFLGTQTYKLADGSKVPSRTFRLKSLKVGDMVIENVTGSMAAVEGSLLLGQSFLGRFKSWSIDNTKHALVLE